MRIASAVIVGVVGLFGAVGVIGVALGMAPTMPRVSSPPSVEPDAMRMVTIGDSIMAGYGLEVDQAWPALIATNTGADVKNLACSGAGFVTIGECGVNFAGLISRAADLHPSVILIESSSNDIGVDPGALAAATAETIEQLRAACPNALLVGLSTVWNDQESLPPEIDESSAALAHAIAQVGGVSIDLQQPLLGHPEWMQDDGVHPTAAGQVYLAELISAELAAHDITLKTPPGATQ